MRDLHDWFILNEIKLDSRGLARRVFMSPCAHAESDLR